MDWLCRCQTQICVGKHAARTRAVVAHLHDAHGVVHHLVLVHLAHTDKAILQRISGGSASTKRKGKKRLRYTPWGVC